MRDAARGDFSIGLPGPSQGVWASWRAPTTRLVEGNAQITAELGASRRGVAARAHGTMGARGGRRPRRVVDGGWKLGFNGGLVRRDIVRPTTRSARVILSRWPRADLTKKMGRSPSRGQPLKGSARIGPPR